MWSLDGYTPRKVSTTKQDALLIRTLTASTTPLASIYTLEVLFIGNKPHIILNGILSKMMLSMATGYDATDFFPVQTSQELQGSIFCYNIIDDNWWSIGFGVPSGGSYEPTYAIFPAVAYPTNAQTGQYSQWCFRAGGSTTRQSFVYSTKAISFSTTGDIYYDWVGPGAFSIFQNNAITMAVQTNTYWFGTETRKRVNKLKAFVDTVQLLDVTGEYYFYSTCLRTDVSNIQ